MLYEEINPTWRINQPNEMWTQTMPENITSTNSNLHKDWKMLNTFEQNYGKEM